MKIHNIRLGFANNSSSSHSLIFLSKEELKNVIDRDCENGQFGWEFFIAASESMKRNYVGQILRSAIHDIMDDDIAIMLAMLLSGSTQSTDEFKNGYVDHQSLYALPKSWSGKGINIEFFNEFKEFFLRPNLVILGGNDNTDEKHELNVDDETFDLALNMDVCEGSMIARKDPEQGFWTLFGRSNGGKLRMSFADGKSVDPVYSYAPELVDLKITDFCPFGCPMCYVDSARNGKHASFKNIEGLIFDLSGLEVFEVAIGGGEPTLHPNFMGVLKCFNYHCIVPNFTTKNYSFLRDIVIMPRVLEYVGSIAISVSNCEELEIAAKIINLYPHHKNKFSIQYVMGMEPKYAFENLLRCANDSGIRQLTLLGYKDSGRGAENKATNKVYDYSNWFELIVIKRKFSVAIDTVLAATWEQGLIDNDVPNWMYHIKDGGFSCYIDAVNMTLNKSSYEDTVAIPLIGNNLKKEIIDAYHSFQNRCVQASG